MESFANMRYKLGARSDWDDLSGLPLGLDLLVPFARSLQSPYSPVVLLWEVDWTEDGDTIKFSVDDTTFEYTKEAINLFFLSMNICPEKEDFPNFYGIMLTNMMPTIKFDLFVKKPEESGQAKILLGTLEGLIDMPQKVNILVIGSASDKHVVGGRTYDTIARLMTTLGYKGAIDLYDPLEIDQTQIVGNFLVTRVSQTVTSFGKIRMSNGAMPNIIFDDAYNQDFGPRILPEITKVLVHPLKLVAGTTKYTLTHQLIGKKEYYYFDNGLIDHSHVVRHNQARTGTLTVLGGGVVEVDDVLKSIKCYGTSETYGSCNHNLLGSVLSSFSLAEYDFELYAGYDYRAHDPLKTIMTNTCRVSIKAMPGDKLKGCELRDQFYYYKREKRLVKGFPPIPVTSLQLGDGCEACTHLGRVLSGIISYSGKPVYDALKLLMAGHIQRPCAREVGIKQASRIATIREHAWKQVSWDYAIQDYLDKFPTSTEEAYKRLMTFLGVALRKRVVPPSAPVVKLLEQKGGVKKFDGITWTYVHEGRRVELLEQYVAFSASKFTPTPKFLFRQMELEDFLVLCNGGRFETLLGDAVHYKEVTAPVGGRGRLLTGDLKYEPKGEDDMMLVKSYESKKVNTYLWKRYSDYSSWTVFVPLITRGDVVCKKKEKVNSTCGGGEWVV